MKALVDTRVAANKAGANTRKVNISVPATMDTQKATLPQILSAMEQALDKPDELFGLVRGLNQNVQSKKFPAAILINQQAARTAVKALARCTDTRYTQCAAYLLGLLDSLMRVGALPQSAVSSLGVVTAVVTALQTYPDALPVQSFGLALLGKLVDGNSTAVSEVCWMERVLGALTLLTKRDTGKADEHTQEKFFVLGACAAIVEKLPMCTSEDRFYDLVNDMFVEVLRLAETTESPDALVCGCRIVLTVVTRLDIDLEEEGLTLIFRLVRRTLVHTPSSLTDTNPSRNNKVAKTLLEFLIRKSPSSSFIERMAGSFKGVALTALEKDAGRGCPVALKCVDAFRTCTLENSPGLTNENTAAASHLTIPVSVQQANTESSCSNTLPNVFPTSTENNTPLSKSQPATSPSPAPPVKSTISASQPVSASSQQQPTQRFLKAIRALYNAVKDKNKHNIEVALNTLIQLCSITSSSSLVETMKPALANIVAVLSPGFDVSVQKQALTLLSLLVSKGFCQILVETHGLITVLGARLNDSPDSAMTAQGWTLMATLASQLPLRFSRLEFLQSAAQFLNKPEVMNSEDKADVQTNALYSLVKAFLSPQRRINEKQVAPGLIRVVEATTNCANRYPNNTEIQTHSSEIVRLSISNCRVGFVRETHFKAMYSLALRTLMLPPTSSVNTLAIGARLLNTLLSIDKAEDAFCAGGLSFITAGSFRFISENKQKSSYLDDCLTLLQPFASSLKPTTPSSTTLAALHAQSVSAPAKVDPNTKLSISKDKSSTPAQDPDPPQKANASITKCVNALVNSVKVKNKQNVSMALNTFCQLFHNLPALNYCRCIQPAFSSIVALFSPSFDVSLQAQAAKLLNLLVVAPNIAKILVSSHNLIKVMSSYLSSCAKPMIVSDCWQVMGVLASQLPHRLNNPELLESAAQFFIKPSTLGSIQQVEPLTKALFSLVNAFLAPECNNIGKPATPGLIHAVEAVIAGANKYPSNLTVQTQSAELIRLSISNCRVGFVRETHFKSMYSLALRIMVIPPTKTVDTLAIGACLLNTLLQIERKEGTLEQSGLQFITVQLFKFILDNCQDTTCLLESVAILQPFALSLKPSTLDTTTLAALHTQSLPAPPEPKETKKAVQQPVSQPQSPSIENPKKKLSIERSQSVPSRSAQTEQETHATQTESNKAAKVQQCESEMSKAIEALKSTMKSKNNKSIEVALNTLLKVCRSATMTECVSILQPVLSTIMSLLSSEFDNTIQQLTVTLIAVLVQSQAICQTLIEKHDISNVLHSFVCSSKDDKTVAQCWTLMEALASRFPFRFNNPEFLQSAAQFLRKPEILDSEVKGETQTKTLYSLVKAFFSPQCRNNGKPAAPGLIRAVEAAIVCANKYPDNPTIQTQASEIVRLSISNCRVGFVRETHFKAMYTLALHTLMLPLTTLPMNTLTIGARLLNTLLRIDIKEGALEQGALQSITVGSFRFISENQQKTTYLADSMVVLRQFASSLKPDTPEATTLSELRAKSLPAQPKPEVTKAVQQPISLQPQPPVVGVGEKPQANISTAQQQSELKDSKQSKQDTHATQTESNPPAQAQQCESEMSKAIEALKSAVQNKNNKSIEVELNTLLQVCRKSAVSEYVLILQPVLSTILSLLSSEFDNTIQQLAVTLITILIQTQAICQTLIENHNLQNVLQSCVCSSKDDVTVVRCWNLLTALLLHFNNPGFLQSAAQFLRKPEILGNETKAQTQTKTLYFLVKAFLSPQCNNSGKPAPPELICTVEAAMFCANKYPDNPTIQTQASELVRLSISNCRVGFVRETHFKQMYTLALHTMTLQQTLGMNTLIVGARLLNTLLHIDVKEDALEQSALQSITVGSFHFISENQQKTTYLADSFVILRPFTSSLKPNTPKKTTLATLHVKSLPAQPKPKETKKAVQQPISLQPQPSVDDVDEEPPTEPNTTREPSPKPTESLNPPPSDDSTPTEQTLEKKKEEAQTQLKRIDECLAQAHHAFSENADKEALFVLQTHALQQQIAETEALLMQLKKQLVESQTQLSKHQSTRQQLTDTMCQLTEQRHALISTLDTH